MLIQDMLVALIVMACGGYAAWTLMPASARRVVALRMLKLALPAPLVKPFRKALVAGNGCGGCDGCGNDASDAPAAPSEHVVKFHPRLQR